VSKIISQRAAARPEETELDGENEVCRDLQMPGSSRSAFLPLRRCERNFFAAFR